MRYAEPQLPAWHITFLKRSEFTDIKQYARRALSKQSPYRGWAGEATRTRHQPKPQLRLKRTNSKGQSRRGNIQPSSSLCNRPALCKSGKAL
ncbi:hypothetical protein AA23498_2803 [Acetobacter nitrogenifigens DSM 23921 = NBRC 105050]|nr:hypothetical protein AA23498_2803 [Acetobacter nitrogenifigens DSM 23921 = NBRC 105050]